MVKRRTPPSALVSASVADPVPASVVVITQSPAVYLSKSFVGEDKFLLHAGDTMALSKEDNHLKDCLESNADGMLMTKYVEDPQNYGVVTGKKMERFLKVESAVEKPKDPISNLAIMAINLSLIHI